MTVAKNLPVLYINRKAALKDNSQWQNRFEINSASSNRVYIIAQNKNKKFWGCSCPGWIFRRNCKHLTALGHPNFSIPFEPLVLNSMTEYKKLINSKNVAV